MEPVLISSEVTRVESLAETYFSNGLWVEIRKFAQAISKQSRIYNWQMQSCFYLLNSIYKISLN